MFSSMLEVIIFQGGGALVKKVYSCGHNIYTLFAQFFSEAMHLQLHAHYNWVQKPKFKESLEKLCVESTAPLM